MTEMQPTLTPSLDWKPGEALLEVLVQGEEVTGTHRLHLLPSTTVGELKGLASILRRHETGENLLLFEENKDKPMDDSLILSQRDRTLRVHLHRCPSVQVTVVCGERYITAFFAPGYSFQAIKIEMLRRGLAKGVQEQLTLHIAGTHTRPDPSSHVGSYVFHPFCELVLELCC